jgi:hypothetical protein
MAATATPKPAKVRRSTDPEGPTLWEKIVQRKWLFGSIAFHIVLGIVATMWIVSHESVSRKKFMKPGNSAEAARQGSEHKVSLGRKQSTMSAPEQAKRVTTNSAFAKVALPEMPEMPTATTDVFANRAIGLGGAGNAFGATGTPGGGGGGGGSGINFFGLRTRAKTIVLCVDVSDSMIMGGAPPPPKPGEPPRTIPAKPQKGPQTYVALEREVARVVKSLDPSMSFSVICFAGDVAPYKTGLVPANDLEKNRAVQFIQQHNPGLNIVAERKDAERQAAGFKPSAGGTSVTKFNHGGTRAFAAMELAFAMNPDVICMVSDGVPTDKEANQFLKDVEERQKQLPRPAVINVVAYLADSGQKFMQDLASKNQGSFKEIKPGMQSFGF